ncbi:tetratricopeptide repeat protein [Streptomyces olivaceoviridis]|uniref:tetratricopeptide repeat protein n=1 Tax=Streptomyces olivaceoviridis TaxID=1921 RepID=UPI0036CF1920
MSGVFDRRPGVAASGDESVAAGRDIGTAVTAPGAIGTQNIGSVTVLTGRGYAESIPRAADVEAPPGLTNIPERPRLFVGRRGELASLESGAAGGGTVVQVLHGLGGVGKSTLAAHWAADHARYSPVWWVAGDSQAAVDAGLAALAAAVEPTLTAFVQQSQLRDWALQWLAAHDDWLVVIDNVTDPADVKPLLAAVSGGRFLITSRRATGWHGIAESLPVDVLAHDEAVSLFTRICPGAGEEIGSVCSELGHLPLAIEQAAAYCLETGTSASEYRDLLADYPADMFTAATEGGDIQRTVARVWRVSLDRLADDPLAVTILLALAWYAPDDIPRALLSTLGSPPAVRRAVGRLAAHSMVTLRGTSSLSLHRLVQAVSRTPDPDDPHRSEAAVAKARDIAAECLVEAVPADSKDLAAWPVWRTLLPHVEAMADYTSSDADSLEVARVFSRTGEFLGTQGMSGRARRLLARGERGLVRLVGPDHPLALIARNRSMNLAPLPLDEALEHVARCRRAWGPRHPETLTARYELVASYIVAGDLEEADRVLTEVMRARSVVLGPGHPETLRTRWSIVLLKARSGDLDAATGLLGQLREDCVRELGEKDPLTLDIRVLSSHLTSGVGRSFATVGFRMVGLVGQTDGEQFRQWFDATTEQLRAELDPEAVREWADESLPEGIRHLADCEAVLGREHKDTISARIALARLHMHMDDFENARSYAQEAAEDARLYLGDEDGTTLFAHLALLLVAVVTKDEVAGIAVSDWFARIAERSAADVDADVQAALLSGLEKVRALLRSADGPRALAPADLPSPSSPGE